MIHADPISQRRLPAALLWTTLLWTALLGVVSTALADDPTAPSIPRLPAGQQLCILPHGYFEPPAAGTESSLDAALALAIDRGMTTASFEFDWPEFERSPETYDLPWFEAQLQQWQARGITHFYVNVSAISIGSVTGPSDLVDPDSPTGYIDGRHVDDPLIVGRFTQMLDQLIPPFLARQGFALSIGNELNVYLAENPDEADHFVNFVAQVRQHVHDTYDGLPVGVILTRQAGLEAEPWQAPIVRNSDYAGYNYYGTDELSAGLEEQVLRSELRTLIATAQGKPLLIQELGVHTALSLGISEEDQAQTAAWMLDELLRHRDTVRWVSWFKMTDFSQPFADAFGELLLEEGTPLWWVNIYKTVLRGMGVCSYDTGQCRPSFDRMIDGLDRNALTVDDLRWVDRQTLQWSAGAIALSFDVARGELTRLREDGGTTGALAQACSQLPGTYVDPALPAPGDGFYYLVRGRGPDLNGSWGNGPREDDTTVCQ